MFEEAALYLDVTTPLSNEFTLVDLKGEEALSALFTYTLVLRTSGDAVDFEQIVGKTITVSISNEAGGFRYINGVVGEWVREETGLRSVVYYGTLRPWLWQLTLAEDHRIFQNKSTPDIIEAVFSDLGFSDYQLSLQGQYDPREYCVQYRETAFNFVSRLMEEEGIFYFFQHEDGKHTMVLADDNSAFETLPNLATAQVLFSPDDDPSDASIRTMRVEENLISGQFDLDDYNFETPETDLKVSASGDKEGMRVYEYPGLFSDTGAGEARANIRMDAREAGRRLIAGESYCRGFIAGYTFTLEKHPVDAINDTYVLRSVRIQATQDRYLNEFVAAPSSVTFRPERKTPKPRIAGSQTALVVGKSGEEIWTDKYGRVKVQFHWDQKGKKDENSSCWIRVSQMWAGKNWGRLFLPRIGQEAIVSFLEGDPDRPIITGTVYNATQAVPYALPDEQTKSTVKTNSSKGGEGFNELRFEDKKDSEEIYIHAQKDMVTHVLDHRQTFVREDDPALEDDQRDLLYVDGNRKVTVAQADSLELHLNEGDFEQTVDKTFTLTVKGDNDTLLIETTAGNVTIKSAKDMTIDVTSDLTIKAGGNINIEAGGDITTKAGGKYSNQAGTSFTNKAGTELTNQAGTSLTNKSGTDLTNQAGMNLTNKGSLNLTNQAGVSLENKGTMVKDSGSAMVQIQGALVKIN